MFISAYVQCSARRREHELRTKILADVVEALIGAAYLDGGFESARVCIYAFVPEISPIKPKMQHHEVVHISTQEDQEDKMLIGYRFQNRSLLLEAMTHSSCGINAKTESYQRLEFLGDAILDILISSHLLNCVLKMSQGQMTQIKAALANKNLLGYLCLRLSTDRALVRIEETGFHRFEEVRYFERIPLWKSLRYHSFEVAQTYRINSQSNQQYSDEIHHSLNEGMTYPWSLLSRLNLGKFYSDMVESIFVAIFVDSRGELLDCERFFERIGLRSYATRMTNGELNVVHLRDELQRLARSLKVDVHVEAERSRVESASFRCTINLDGVTIAETKDCVSKDEAYLDYARAAVHFLRRRPIPDADGRK